jgi:hypothetical protein
MEGKPMRTWGDVDKFLAKHDLPYYVMRFNMSTAGRLVDVMTGQVVASTVKEAAKWLK